MPISLLPRETKSVASLRSDRHAVESLIGMSVERLIGFSGIRRIAPGGPEAAATRNSVNPRFSHESGDTLLAYARRSQDRPGPGSEKSGSRGRSSGDGGSRAPWGSRSNSRASVRCVPGAIHVIIPAANVRPRSSSTQSVTTVDNQRSTPTRRSGGGRSLSRAPEWERSRRGRTRVHPGTPRVHATVHGP